jgi:RNA polymerase sigma factor (sigma-70 family)
LRAVPRDTHRHNSVEEIPDDIPSSEPSPEELIIQKERQSAVNYALRQLSPKDRMLFYRKYYYLQSTAQIASELGMTERSVEGKLYRLKKQLRKMLGGEVHE